MHSIKNIKHSIEIYNGSEKICIKLFDYLVEKGFVVNCDFVKSIWINEVKSDLVQILLAKDAFVHGYIIGKEAKNEPA